MSPVRILEGLGPYAQVGTAVLPFAVSIGLRLLFGRSRLLDALVTVATAWFTLNVFVAPFSARMRQDLMDMRSMLP
jgi:hypothetical protein